jgi:hypothetical protein
MNESQKKTKNQRQAEFQQQMLAKANSQKQKQIIAAETTTPCEHALPVEDAPIRLFSELYANNDYQVLQKLEAAQPAQYNNIKTLDDLLARDKRREKDGFPRKIRIGRIVRPGKGGKNKVVVVPTTIEEKFIHDTRPPKPEEEQAAGGSGQGEEGEVIGEQPVQQEGVPGTGAGEGGGEGHDVDSDAYNLGKILTEQFKLPNLQQKGKKKSLTNYSYDLTDKNRGSGQLLDKKATLRQILYTNIGLGRVTEPQNINTQDLLIGPRDRIYRTLSKEQDYESQALVFFLRDYSGSMSGKPTEIVVSQHVLIYSWLMYQYQQQVETRFILHDTEAKEVPEFYDYYRLSVAGGTKIAAAYQLVNEIVEKENLAAEYNIYIFHGTDGEDWDSEGTAALKEMEKMFAYVNRIGVSIVRPAYGSPNNALQNYLRKSNYLEQKRNLLRLNLLRETATEQELINGIKELISENAASQSAR